MDAPENDARKDNEGSVGEDIKDPNCIMEKSLETHEYGKVCLM